MEKIEIEKDNRGLNKTRLEAFCDGVFAIAITLLILEVKIPRHEDLIHYGGLRPYLVQLWLNYFAYAFSFLVIGLWWSNNHYLSRLFTHTDHYFSMLTIGFLMSIAFLPFLAQVSSVGFCGLSTCDLYLFMKLGTGDPASLI